MARRIRFKNEPSPYYTGPVSYTYPTTGTGCANRFCPFCGSTYWDYAPAGGRKCLTCGREYGRCDDSDYRGKEFSVCLGGVPLYENQRMNDAYDNACDVIRYKEDPDRLDALARSYYGHAHLRLDGGDYYHDPEYEYIREQLRYDVPLVELRELCWRRGYAENMEVGDRYIVPGTTVSIVRTKNSKTKKPAKHRLWR